MTQKQRPPSILILFVLEMIVGLSTLIGGLILFAIVDARFAAIASVLGVISLIIAWGLWAGKGWAWTVVLVFAVIGVLTDLGSVALGNVGSSLGIVGLLLNLLLDLGLLLNLLVIYYLRRPYVKSFFRRESFVLET